jgi:dCMP deaminase
MKEKWVKRHMRHAKFVGEDCNPCYARKIGVVIIDPRNNKVLGTGFNGPPRGVPHNDDPKYLDKVVWEKLILEEKQKLQFMLAPGEEITDESLKVRFIEKCGNSKECPRKVIGAKSGERLELCSCAHAETNAIVNASNDLFGAYMFCWCPVPCWECSKLIVNSGMKRVYCWNEDYSLGSRFLLEEAGVEIIEHPKEYYLEIS